MKKQFIAKLLVLCMVLAMLPVAVFAAEQSAPGTREGGTYKVSLDANVSHGTVVIVYSTEPDATATLTTGGSGIDVARGSKITVKITPEDGYKFSASYKYGESGTPISINTIETQIEVKDSVIISATFTSNNTNTPTTPDSGGSSSSGSSGGSSSTETTKNPDGSTTTTVTKPNGTVTETTKNPDGSQTVVETKKDGTETTTKTDAAGNKSETVAKPDGTAETKVTQKDGSTSTTKVDAEGKETAEVKLTQQAVNAATSKDATAPIALPMPEVSATKSTETAPTVTVSLPRGVETAKVEIPVENVNKGTVAIIVHADGTEEIVKTSVATENGVAVKLSDGATVKVVDNSKNFVDMSSHWGRDAADFASSRDLFQGTSNTTFTPDTSMTGGMFVTALARLDGVDTDGGNEWYDKGVAWAVENNISDGSNPKAPVTREQMILMIWKYAGSPASSASALSGFADASAISGNAADAMAWAVSVGLVNGVSPTSLDPQGGATRAQVATLFMRYIEQIASK